jgi:hypothetical protein
MCLAGPAKALDVLSGTQTLNAGFPQQLGRLSRDGIPSDWSQTKAFPGVINPTTSYAYDVVDVTFAPNSTQDVYYQISIDDAATDVFSSAYLGSYDPLSKSANYLGDAGSSGNFFGVDPVFYQIKVAAGGSLALLFNQTAVGSFSSYNYLVEAFSDTGFDEDFPASGGVPEPSTWMMMFLGLGVVGGALRYRGSRAAAVA